MTDINPFYSAKATPEALEKMMQVREAYKTLNDLLEELQPMQGVGALRKLTPREMLAVPKRVNIGGREISLAKTNLEQSSMWAIKAISHYNVAE